MAKRTKTHCLKTLKNKRRRKRTIKRRQKQRGGYAPLVGSPWSPSNDSTWGTTNYYGYNYYKPDIQLALVPTRTGNGL
jgi:hypothetical protein